MNLEEYLRESGVAGSDHFGVHRFARQLILARRNVEVLVEVLDGLESAPRNQVGPADLRTACDLTAGVAAFFAPEFHMGQRATSLWGDLRHALTQACSFPEGLDLALTVPQAATRARRLMHYLRNHSATELACNFGRARTLHDNGWLLVLLTGAFFGVSTYFVAAMLNPWLSIGMAATIGGGAAASAGSLISSVLRGEPAVVPWPLVALALRVIPAQYRVEYALEFRAELYELSLVRQVEYSVNVALHAPNLRRSLSKATRPEHDGSVET